MLRQTAFFTLLGFILITLMSCQAHSTSQTAQPHALPTWRPEIPQGALTLRDHSKTVYQAFQKDTYTFDVWFQDQAVGVMLWDIRTLSSGDTAYYLQFTPNDPRNALLIDDSDRTMTIVLPIYLQGQYDLHYLTYDKALSPSSAVWEHSRIATDDTPPVSLPKASVWMTRLPSQAQASGQNESFLSLVDVFRPLGRDVVEETYDLSPHIELTAEGLSFNVPLRNGYDIEQWGIVSKHTLVDWSDPTALDDLRVADLNRMRKWGARGQRYITPESYDPSSPRGFYLNPAQHIGARFLVSPAKGNFFADFRELALMNAIETQNTEGYWTMTQRSNWLYNDYGIDGGYYDTRFSTDAATFLVNAYERYPDPTIIHAARRYRDFLVDFATHHHHETQSGGWFIYDYMHPAHKATPTHTSLNHQLSEVNFFLAMEKIEHDPNATSLITRALQAIRDTVDHWEKDDHDLAYAFYPDGTFGGQDYPLLTLKDLRITHAYLQNLETFKAPSAFKDPVFHDLSYIEQLIAIKTAYLKSKNLPLY